MDGWCVRSVVDVGVDLLIVIKDLNGLWVAYLKDYGDIAKLLNKVLVDFTPLYPSSMARV